MMHCWRYLLIFLGLFCSSSSQAFVSSVWKYIKQYQLGIEYSQSIDQVRMSYETDRNDAVRRDCEASSDHAEQELCSLTMLAGKSSGYGIFLQQAFKRKRNFHFAVDLGFNFRYLHGGTMPEDELQLKQDAYPVTHASFSLVSFIALPYIQLGYTPKSRFPDILVSIGPSLQTAFGKVTINEQSRNVVVALSSHAVGYAELEVVLLRFGKGAFSLYAAVDKAGAESTPFFPDDLEDIRDIKAGFRRGTGGQLNGFGAKLLLNWP